MPIGLDEASQSWLAGADNLLDNFFKRGSSSSVARGGRRVAAPDSGVASKAGVKRRIGAIGGIEDSSTAKKVKSYSSHSKDANPRPRQSTLVHKDKGSQLSLTKSKTGTKVKGKSRTALSDLTSALQNSSQRQASSRPRAFHAAHPGSPTRGKSISPTKKTEADRGILEIDDSSPSDSENDVPPPLPMCTPTPGSGKTPRRPLKKTIHRTEQALPTPPSSSMPFCRSCTDVPNDQDRSLSPTPDPTVTIANKEKRKSNTDGVGKADVLTRTPFTFSATSSTRQAYPTPTSMAVPRLKLLHTNKNKESSSRPLPAPDLALDSEFSSTPLSSSEDSLRIRFEDEKKEEEGKEKKPESIVKSTRRNKEDKSKFYTVIPSSQTQYIHYSPTKQRHANSFPAFKLEPPPLTVIPSSQSPSSPPSSSQIISLSPRKTRKPPPILTPGLAIPSTKTNQGGAIQNSLKSNTLNFVVPTSQEDEVEVSLADDATLKFSQLGKEHASVSAGTEDETRSVRDPRDEKEEEEGSSGRQGDSHLQSQDDIVIENKKKNNVVTATGASQSTQFRFINAMLDDLERLAEETRANIVTVSQVLSRPPVPIQSRERTCTTAGEVSRGSGSRGGRRSDSQENDDLESHEGARNQLCMQSSVTEPDASQWDEDPFSLTNEAYARHLGLSHDAVRERSDSTGVNDEDDRTGLSGSPRTYTQSSATQPDTDDEDPFPTLPPASTAESTADRAAVDKLLLTSPEKHKSYSHDRLEKRDQPDSSQTGSETQNDSDDESLNPRLQIPNVASQIDTHHRHIFSPNVSSSTRGASMFRRRDDRSFVLAHHDIAGGESQEDESEKEYEPMPRAVRDFLLMFSQTQESESEH